MPSSDEVIVTAVRIIAEWDANDLFVGPRLGQTPQCTPGWCRQRKGLGNVDACNPRLILESFDECD